MSGFAFPFTLTTASAPGIYLISPKYHTLIDQNVSPFLSSITKRRRRNNVRKLPNVVLKQMWVIAPRICLLPSRSSSKLDFFLLWFGNAQISANSTRVAGEKKTKKPWQAVTSPIFLELDSDYCLKQGNAKGNDNDCIYHFSLHCVTSKNTNHRATPFCVVHGVSNQTCCFSFSPSFIDPLDILLCCFISFPLSFVVIIRCPIPWMSNNCDWRFSIVFFLCSANSLKQFFFWSSSVLASFQNHICVA